jgi:Ca2+-binding RTX toxin-like protein
VVDLVNGALTRGSLALGDTLVSIEGVITGNKADILRGNDADNMLNGAAGTDVLTGAAGADTLIGGGGADSLTGGSGADAFLFYGTADFKDVITDFTQGEDVIQIEGTAIGLGSYAGTLDASRFHSGTSNAAADIYDRLIFNTSTTTLWYDRDGSGSKFAAVLVADLQAGATLTLTDIVII